jgi:DNA (cytosine-5)-methyltransferase 1
MSGEDIAPCLIKSMSSGVGNTQDAQIIAHTLKGEGFDASKDGTGRGTPLVPVAIGDACLTPWDSQQKRIYAANADHAPALSGSDGGGGRYPPAYAVPLQEVGKRTGVSTDDPRAGIGIGQDGDPMFTLQASAQHGVAHAVGVQASQSGVRLNDTAGTLDANYGPRRHNGVMVPVDGGDKPHVLAAINQNQETHHADAAQTGPVEALRALRRAVGEEAFTVWGFGILAALQSPEVLRSALHGCGLRPAAFSRSWVVYCSLSRPQDGPGWLMQSLRETGCEGCPPQGWEPSEQLTGELGAYLSQLSQPGPQAERLMRDLWFAAEGAGVLREALSAVQAMGRSAGREGQPAHAGMAVRRLTATECEFLQGFPRGYTAIPWKKKPADQCPDGPRYKALGNSMAVPVMRWIGARIARHLRGEL